MTIPKTLALYAVTGAALCAALTACAPEDGASPAPKPAPAVSEPQSAPAPLTPEDLFLTAARSVSPELGAVPDSELVDLGQAVCAGFDAGLTTGQVGAAMTKPGALTATEAGAVVGAATGNGGLCPEHGDAARGV
jgi:hypothetical protein